MSELRIERLRRLIEEQYEKSPTGCGGSFGELLCYELHSVGLVFTEIAAKWRVSLPTLGMLIADHCNRMEDDPAVDHYYTKSYEEILADLARKPVPVGELSARGYGDRPPEPVGPPNVLVREDDTGRTTSPTARRVEGDDDEWEIRVPGRWWRKERVYWGERTVWHSYPDGTRAGTSLESWLCDIWQVAVWKEEEAAGG